MTRPDREARRQNWNRVAPMMSEWGWAISAMERPAGLVLLDRLNLRDGARVLDVATGTGDAGFEAASRVGGGQVVGLDIGDDNVRLANDNARERGVDNYEAVVGDACELDFDDESFDAVFCRMSVGLFPDPELSVREMVRVLVPGGRVGLAMWAAPEKNPWMTAVTNQVQELLKLPPAESGGTSCFRHSEPGSLLALLEQAGVVDATEETVEVAQPFESPEKYWQMISTLTPGVVRPLAAATPEQRKEVEKAVLARLHQQTNEKGEMIARGCAWVVAGSKPSR